MEIIKTADYRATYGYRPKTVTASL